MASISDLLGIGNFALNLGNYFNASSANEELMAQSAKYNEYFMDKQFDLQKQYAEYTGTHAHSWEVQDLINAGLNPVLSANAGNTYSTGNFSFGQAQGAVNSAMARSSILNQTSEAMCRYAQTASNVALQKAQGHQAVTQATLNNAQTTLSNLNSMAQSIRNSFLPKEIKASIDNMISQTQLNNVTATTRWMDAWSNRMNAQSNALNAKGNYYYNTHRALGFYDSTSSTNSLKVPFVSQSYTRSYGRSW